ncbi:MAG: hypothetical protein MAG715_00036 [Methanonatronarchaeales archaeon]|nr:hypothetical protein [Methanonatronarchaeales archaeon]
MNTASEPGDSVARDLVAEKIAGEVTLSPEPGRTLCKWREEFGVTQTQLAERMEVSPSVISDYESDRRRSPGVRIIRNFINALIRVDESRGGHVLGELARKIGIGVDFEGVMAISEYSRPVSVEELAEDVGGEVVVEGTPGVSVNGYTVIDSLKAIQKLSPEEFYRLYGWSTERALVFCRVTTGKSPLVAIRVTNLKPGVVVLHGIEEVDPVAVKIAEVEGIPLIRTVMDVDAMVENLYRSGKR